MTTRDPDLCVITCAVSGVLASVVAIFLMARTGNVYPQVGLQPAVIGFVATLSDPGGRLLMSVTARQFVMLGVLGGYTTFSSFSLQTLNLARDGEWLYASANVVLSVILCLLAVWFGHVVARLINR